MTHIHHRLLGVLTLAVAAATLACGGSDITDPYAAQRTALAHAEAQWNATGIRNYDYDLVSHNLGAYDSVQVQVRNDQVTLSKSYLDGQTTPLGETIPQFFAAIDDAITSGLSVAVTFDGQIGYPLAGSVNAPIQNPGGGTNWKILNLKQP